MRLAFWNGMKLIVKCIEVFFFVVIVLQDLLAKRQARLRRVMETET